MVERTIAGESICGMRERYGPRSEAAARLHPDPDHERTGRAAAQRDAPDLLQLLVEHMGDPGLAGYAGTRLDRIDPTLAVHRHARVRRDRHPIAFASHDRVAVGVELE